MQDNTVLSTVGGKIVDVLNRRVYKGRLLIRDGIIDSIEEDDRVDDIYIIPCFVDAHVHIESSMLVPSEFARLALCHGVIASVSDPHEIANVLGIEGIRFMAKNGKNTPFRFYFGAPSCVPATGLDASGADLGIEDIDNLLQWEDIHYLSEVMNFPGVIARDNGLLGKIAAAKRYGKPVDGHAPGLTGSMLDSYLQAGIETDHETTSYDEGREKLLKGMKLLIREGSAAKNLDALAPLIREFPSLCMLCSDDIHPDDLLKGHVNLMVKRLLNSGYDLFETLRCASLNAACHYGIDMGFLQRGDRADFLLVDNLNELNILLTVVDGNTVALNGKCLIGKIGLDAINRFEACEKRPSQFAVKAGNGSMRVIEALNGQIYTNRIFVEPKIESGFVRPDIEGDILKIALINRYTDQDPAVGFVKGFGLKRGAIASSVSHDSHNIVAVGTNDRDIAEAVNMIIRHKGGLSISDGVRQEILPLPVAGLMSDREGGYVAMKYSELDNMARSLGSQFTAPFMTLSFMALVVIPEIKISTNGLFELSIFSNVPLFSG